MSVRKRRVRRRPIVLIHNARDTVLTSKPIADAWILDGGNGLTTKAALLAANDDKTVTTYLWQTSAAHYRWEHESDEVVTIVEGEVYLRDETAEGDVERRLGAGDVAFFPTGSRSLWRVPVGLRKVSTLIRHTPEPFASLIWFARKIKQVTFA